MTPPREAAFFDFDRTVLDGDAGVLFGKDLLRLRRRRVRDQDRGTLAWALRNLRHEVGTAALYSWAGILGVGTKLGLVKRSRLIRIAYAKLRGYSHTELRGLAQDYFDEVLVHRILPDARREMERHRAEHRRVVVVSTGMHLVIDPVKRHLSVDDVIAVTLHAPGGILDGHVTGPLWGQEKADAVRAYAHAQGLRLPNSWAYTDHYSDLALLRLVGNPVAVNPDVRLRWHARRHRWPIQEWASHPPQAATKRLSSTAG